jgi:hypothetical protein
MLNPINWILLVVEIVDFLDEEQAGWLKKKVVRGRKWNQKSRDTHTNLATSTHGFIKGKSLAQLRQYAKGSQQNGEPWSTLGWSACTPGQMAEW